MKNIFIALIWLLVAPNVYADSVYDAHTKVELIAEHQSIKPGELFTVGLRMVMDEGWHVYWKNPGDSGMSPKIKWQVSSAIHPSDIQWPYPKRINVGPLTSYGYEQQVLFPILMGVDSLMLKEGQPITLEATVNWLACKVECIPGKAVMSLTLPVSTQTPAVHVAWQQDFQDARKHLPVSEPTQIPSVEINPSFIILIFKKAPVPGQLEFFSERSDLIEHAAVQNIEPYRDGFRLIIQKSNLFPAKIDRLKGLLVQKDHAFLMDAPISVAPVSSISSLNLALACLFALIGGLILNLMPCVLPVLSLKVLSLVKYKSSRLESFRHGLMFTLGVLCSFWILAGVLIVLKAAEQNIGWGFQFQSPVFVGAIALLLFVLALNLFGLFEWNIFLGGHVLQSKGFMGSFGGGVLSTIVATPCTAPFMGAALSYALTQPFIYSILIFTCLGFGMALPYLMLSANPAWLKFIPKPGPWMITLKRIFGVMLMLCVFWLIWVLSLQIGLYKPSAHLNNQGIAWQEFSSTKLKALQAGKQPIFIDFTAAWCLTCQVNDRTIFSQKSVIERFKALSIVPLKADWTNYDPDITQALAAYGRNSIPLYVYYPDPKGEAVILPELITPGIIIEHLE